MTDKEPQKGVERWLGLIRDGGLTGERVRAFPAFKDTTGLPGSTTWTLPFLTLLYARTRKEGT